MWSCYSLPPNFCMLGVGLGVHVVHGACFTVYSTCGLNMRGFMFIVYLSIVVHWILGFVSKTPACFFFSACKIIVLFQVNSHYGPTRSSPPDCVEWTLFFIHESRYMCPPCVSPSQTPKVYVEQWSPSTSTAAVVLLLCGVSIGKPIGIFKFIN